MAWREDNPWYAPIEAAMEAEKAAGEPMFMGFPDRWFDRSLYRCKNDHVSRTFLKSEEHGDRCLACMEGVRLTFPEDRDGPCVPATVGAPSRTAR